MDNQNELNQNQSTDPVPTDNDKIPSTPQPQPINVPAPEKETSLASQPQPSIIGPAEQSRPEKQTNGVLSFAVTIIVALLLTQLINMFFFQSYRVFGSSMFPTFHDGDRLIVSKVGKTTSKVTKSDYQPKRGQVIVFTSPKDPDIQLIKRVIGLPGERVVVKNSKITVYNKEHPEGFNPDDAEYGKDIPPTSGEADVTVPENHVFVSGDNRIGSNSFDSRDGLGTVPEELIIGKVDVRLWPLQNARFF